MAQKKISELTELLSAVSNGDEFIINADGATKKVKASLLASSLVELFGSGTGGAGLHNSLFRGKNLGTVYTAEQMAQVQAGTFNDLWIGDYWVINRVTWRIAHFDYWMNCGDTATTKHHIVVVPDTNLYTVAMNSGNVTTGGYAGSEMRSSALANALSTAKTAFNNHVLSVRRYFTNAVANGRPSASAWFDSECDLMSEAMVYGNYVFSPTSDGTNVPANYNVDYKQLALFVLAPQFICNRAWYWLLNVVSAAFFAAVNGNGTAASIRASIGAGLRPTIAIS